MTSKGSTAKPTKLNREAKTLLLDTFELTASASRNILISNVKQMFEKGTIRTLAAAENLIKLIQDNKMEQFDEKMKKLDMAANTKAATRQVQGCSNPGIRIRSGCRTGWKGPFSPFAEKRLSRSPRPRGAIWSVSKRIRNWKMWPRLQIPPALRRSLTTTPGNAIWRHWSARRPRRDGSPKAGTWNSNRN